MLSDILPFWAKYWSYIVIGCVTFFVTILFTKRASNGEIRDKKGPPNVSFESESSSVDAHTEDINGADEDIDEPALPKFLEHISYEYKRPTENDIKRRALKFYNIANARRTLRFFSNDPIPKSVIHDLIRAAGTV